MTSAKLRALGDLEVYAERQMAIGRGLVFDNHAAQDEGTTTRVNKDDS